MPQASEEASMSRCSFSACAWCASCKSLRAFAKSLSNCSFCAWKTRRKKRIPLGIKHATMVNKGEQGDEWWFYLWWMVISGITYIYIIIYIIYIWYKGDMTEYNGILVRWSSVPRLGSINSAQHYVNLYSYVQYELLHLYIEIENIRECSTSNN